MVNFRSNAQAMNQPGGYVASRVGVSGNEGSNVPKLSPSQAFNLNTTLATPEHWAIQGGKYALAAPVDVLDSMGALFPGVERGQINESVYNAIGMRGFGAWVKEHESGVEVGSGLLGAAAVGFAAEAAATRLVGSAWFAATGVGRATQGFVQMTNNAQIAARKATELAAMEGRTLGTMEGANLRLIGAKSLELAAKAGVSELAIAATLNKNSAVWSDDMAQNMLFAGLGISIGGVLGGIQGRSMVQRWANSDVVKMANAAYADPHGFEAASNKALINALDNGIAAGQRVSPKLSTSITAMALNSRSEDALGSLRSSIKTNWQAEYERSLAILTKRGSFGVKGSDFGLEASSEGFNLKEGLHKDPALIFGLSSVAKMPKGLDDTQFLRERKIQIDALRTPTSPTVQVSAAALAKAAALDAEVPLRLINGAWHTLSESADIASYRPGKTTFRRASNNTAQLEWDSSSVGTITMREDGAISKQWDNLGIHDHLQAVEAMTEMMDSNLAKGLTLKLPKTPHWTQLDMAVEYTARGGLVDFTASGIKDLAEAQLKSLQIKSAAIANLPTLDLNTRVKFNLPLATAYERLQDPAGSELKAWAAMATSPNATLADIKQLRVEFNKTMDLLSDAKVTDSLDGGMFSFNRVQSPKARGTWMNPVVGFFEDTPVNTWTRFNLAEDIAQSVADRLGTMKNQRRAPLVATLTEATTANPGLYQKLGNVAELADNQIGGTSKGSVTASQFLTKEHLARNSDTLLAAQAIRRIVNRVVENTVDAALKPITPLIDAMTATAGTKSRVLFNQYLSYASGWDISKTVQGSDGLWRFELNHESAQNASRLGRVVQRGETLVTHTGQELVLDDLGHQMRIAIEDQTKKILKETNVLREARGLEPLNLRPFYTPPQSTTGKFIGFTLDANGRTVPGGAIIADSQQEYDSILSKMEANLKPGEKILNQDQIKAQVDLWDSAGMDFIDPTHLAKPNRSSRGALTEQRINAHGIEDSLAYIKHGYEQIGNGTLRTIFDSQLKAAKVHSAALLNAKQGGKATMMTPKNIFDIYGDTLLGIPASRDSRGLAGALQGADQYADAVIAKIWPGMQTMQRFVPDILNRLPVTGPTIRKLQSMRGIQTFDDLATALGPHMPFAQAVEFAEYTNGIVPPWKAKDMARHVNRLGSGIILRWLELPHALMNVAGIVTNMPGIIGASHVPLMGRVAEVGVPDTMKIMALGIKRMHSRASRADWDMMIKNGDSSQDVAELHHQTSMMEGKSSTMRVLTGDPRYADWRKMPPGNARRKAQLRFLGVEGMASIVTDTSENWSRQVSHFIGLQLADYHGITGMEARHQFARQIANDAIANYDPLNRPEIYQSALGSMYGLFMSYSQNWYQRMFRYMEGAEYKAVGRSLALQASMFGFMGVPGVRQLADLMGGEEDGDGLLDGIYKRYGTAVGSVVAQGGLNQITTLLGVLPAVSLSARGDMNFRHPAIDFASTGVIPTPPGLEVLKDLIGGTWEVMAKMTNPSIPMSGRHAAEILARNMPNRMMRGALTVLAAGGQEADAYGNMMSETQSAAESMFRVLGLRSARQQAEIEAYFGNKRALEIDAARLDTVRQASRALIRSGEMDRLPEVFQSYLDAGGKPWNYPNWIKGLIREASNTRTENQLLRSLRNPSQQLLAQRIQLYSGGF